MKKLTKEQWEGVKERFYKEFLNPDTFSSKSPLHPKYENGKIGHLVNDVISFFEKEVVEDTETPGEEKCLYCEFGHNGKNNPHAGTHFKQEGGRCTQCGAIFPQEKGSKPESSWTEEFDDLLKVFNINDKKQTEFEVKVDSAVKFFISKLVSEAEKRGYNLALEEAEKVADKTITDGIEEFVAYKIIEALKALKK